MNRLVVDANVLFGALISGRDEYLTLFAEYQLFLPDFALHEMQIYEEMILRKTKLSPEKPTGPSFFASHRLKQASLSAGLRLAAEGQGVRSFLVAAILPPPPLIEQHAVDLFVRVQGVEMSGGFLSIKEWDTETGECLRTFQNIPYLNVQGWDFRGAEHDFTAEDIKLLRMYGAIFSEEDEARWLEILTEEEAYFAGGA